MPKAVNLPAKTFVVMQKKLPNTSNPSPLENSEHMKVLDDESGKNIDRGTFNERTCPSRFTSECFAPGVEAATVRPVDIVIAKDQL